MAGGQLTMPYGGATLRDAGRLIAACTAICSFAAGTIHVSAAADHTNLPVMMAGFLVVATLQVAFGALLLWRRPNRLILLGAFAMMASSIGLWAVSRTAGLPFLPGGHMEPVGFKDGITVVLELATLPGILLLMSRELQSLLLPSQRLGTQTVSTVGMFAFILMVPALMLGGGEHHSHDEMVAAGKHSHGHDDGTQTASTGHRHGDPGRGSAAHGHRNGSSDAHRAGSGHASSASTRKGHGHSRMSSHGTLHTGGTLLAHDDGGNARRHSGGHSGGGNHGSRNGSARGGPSGSRDSGGDDHEHGSGSGSAHDGGGSDVANGSGSHGDHGSGGHEDEPNGIAIETATAGEDGKPGRGAAIVYRGDPSESEGTGHSHGASSCRPTSEQQAAADKLYRATDAALRKYDHAPWRALADGFYYAFGPTDRIMHMVNPSRRSDRTILNPDQIESFLYAMTDQGWVAIGGMYIMPAYGMAGPEIGGCLTKWHYHGGFGGRIASAGSMEKTPEMLHVWTYPGLDPWGHYDGRELSQLWTPGKHVPSVCRKSGDSSDVCLP
jgi:hypothetical protein